MKTTTLKETMAPIFILILGKILDFFAAHADEMVAAIKEKFLSANTDPEVIAAVQNLGFDPNETNLDKLHGLLKAKGEDADQLASLLVSKTVV